MMNYIPDLNGNVIVESKYTNFQSPHTFSERQYVRVSTHQKIDLQGIRLGLNGFYTTENQSLYNSNYLKFYFDKPNLDDIIRKKKTKLIIETKQNLDDLKYNKSKSVKENEYLENQKLLLEKKIQERKNQINEEWESNLNSNHLKDSSSLNQSFKFDELKEPQTKNDSLTDAQLRRLYSSLIAIQNKQKQADSLYQDLKNQYELDSIKLDEYQNSRLETPDISELNNSAVYNKLNKVQKVFSKIEKLEIGNANPLIDPLSIYGLPIRGICNSFINKNTQIEWAVGLIPSIGVVQFDRKKTLFTRNLSTIEIEQKINGLKLKTFGHLIWDNSKSVELIKYKNAIGGIGLNGTIFKNMNIVSSVAISSFSITQMSQGEKQIASTADIPGQRLKDKLAHHLVVSQNIYKKQLIAELKSQRNGVVFRNLGNPLIRNQFLENSIKLKINSFDNQILASVFYKQYSSLTLPYSGNQYAFQNNGYGLSLQSKFKNKKSPNFMISFTPFEQGNNHPDTLLRVNSRCNLFNSGIFWNWSNKKTRISIQSYFSQSQLLLNDTMVNNFKSLNLQFNIIKNNGFQFSLMTNSSVTDPAIDSLQNKGCQFNFGKTSPHLQWWISGKYFQQENGAFRRGTQISVSSTVSKKTRATLTAGFDEYYKVWGIQHIQPAFTGNFKLNFSI